MLRRSVTELHFVKTRTPMPTVEVHADSLESQGLIFGLVVEETLASFAKTHPDCVATIYTYGVMSVNFHEKAWSEFLIVAGDQRVLIVLGETFERLNGVKSRFSDCIRPSEGSRAFHIEEGRLWEVEDALNWFAVEPTKKENQDVDEETLESDAVGDDDWGDEDGELASPLGGESEELSTIERVQQPARYRAARSDASVGSIRQEIERVFGLPSGSVAILGPDGRALRSDALIRTVRKRWAEA